MRKFLPSMRILLSIKEKPKLTDVLKLIAFVQEKVKKKTLIWKQKWLLLERIDADKVEQKLQSQEVSPDTQIQ